MIIYLHGFASSGNSAKVSQLKQHFKDTMVVAPDLPPDPQKAIEMIKGIVKNAHSKGEKKFLFLGTSLGGFYAWYASALFDSPAILVNPCIHPHETTKQWLGRNKNFGTGKEFEWLQEHLDQLNEMTKWVNSHYKSKLISIEVAMDDALLDAKEIISHFEASEVNVHDTGGHRFDNWSDVFPNVQKKHDNIKERYDPDPLI